jgi:Protein phosphatase 2C
LIVFFNIQSTTHISSYRSKIARKDKAHLPDERARITSLNGTIHIPPHNPNLSRVVVYSAAAQPPESIGLAMSRSLGDWEWKRIGVTAEPIVHVLDLVHYCQHPLDASKAAANADENYCSLLLIAASDGVWDLRRPEFYAKRFRESFFPSIINNNDHGVPFHRRLFEACVNVFWQVAPAQAQWYRDDMSVIVMEANP